jgi:hypothetical protein
MADTAATPSLPDVVDKNRVAALTQPRSTAPQTGPLLSLAAGWDAHAADLRKRAGGLMTRAASMRGGSPDAVDRLATQDPLTLEHAARRNIISATVLESCATDLRRHVRLVTRDGLERLLAAVETVAGDVETAATMHATVDFSDLMETDDETGVPPN